MMSERQQRLIRAMGAAGYAYDRFESTDEWVRFFTERGGTIAFSGLGELEEWLYSVVFEDPEVAYKVQRILNMEVNV